MPIDGSEWTVHRSKCSWDRKIVVTKLDDKWLSSPRVFLSAADIGVERGLLPPESCFMVKGWNRGVCAIIVMMAMTELVEFREAC